jgi:dynein heavy chain
MGRLEKLCEELPGRKPHREFRLWLTSYPSTAFPVPVLQNGVKMTNEPPMGLKANLLSSYGTHPISDKAWFEQSQHPKTFRKLLFGLCFFHAFIQERRIFGPLGWNIQYQFNESDLRISARQLNIFVDEYPEKVPLDALNYLTGECNYGGRVTDDKDRTLIAVILAKFYSEDCYASDDYKFSPSGLYYAPKHCDFDGYIDYIRKLPNYQEPEAYGFHENAAITKNQNNTNNMLNTILICQGSGGGGGGGASSDSQIKKVADNILSEIPANFDVKGAEKKYPISYTQSMNTVLTQELDRFNGLISVIRSSLQNLKKAIKGEVLMSAELEAAFNSLLIGQVPNMWIKKSFPSLKPLGGYIADLMERLGWFTEWIANGLPKILWISRFHFTQGFLTGTKQNYARKYKIAIDLLDYDFEVLDTLEEAEANPPQDGINVIGPYIEGCKWDSEAKKLEESDPKVLYTKCPPVWYKPCKVEEMSKMKVYECPMYKTSVRKGVLMTTGHSTNFVLKMRMPTKKDASHWTLRGVALLLSLDD